MALVGEPQLSRQPGEIVVAAGESLERRPHAQSNPVRGDCVTSGLPEDPAEVMGRRGELAREVGQRALRVGCEQLASALDQRRAGSRRGGPAGPDWTRSCCSSTRATSDSERSNTAC